MCEGTTGQWFCSVWKTVGFLATFSTILCLAGLVCFLVVIKGGKYRRETGWPLISGMLTLVALIQFAVLIAVWYLYEHDDQFTIPGWHLGASWDISLASAILSLATAVGLTVSAYLLPPEEGYEFLEDDVDA
ncbi:hypothetical protein QQS21_002225 [Conoideocrella luteorostrata]|uniref:Uncharacterized protein n=1 Tax=Conoideocrella luteorostrata TaxID=1105319 RepID=A0AAJ0G1E7_9HYPO|nr:hypothetical protein QQS21_002225 [Conoideocrella luteorostrata]